MITKESQSSYWKGKKIEQIKSYWNSKSAILRSKWFAKYLKNYEFDSICEAGMFSGRNIKYLLEEFPNKVVDGFDVNTKAVNFAKEKLSKANIWNMNIYDVGQMDREYDIIFTSGTMIHLLPYTICDVIKALVKKSNRYIMHIEECGSGELIKGPKNMGPQKKISDQLQFAPNLVQEYKDVGYDVKTVYLPPEIRTNGAAELIIVEL